MYLHCHTCDWSQDDFWNFKFKIEYCSYKKSWFKYRLYLGYNPISKTIEDIKWLAKPRLMELEKDVFFDLIKYTKVPVYRFKSNKKSICRFFSWNWLLLELIKEWKNFRNMKWITFKQWKRDSNIAVCPKCGDRNFDID